MVNNNYKTGKRKVVSYTRYSSDNQTENSTKYQRTRNFAYAAANNMYVVKEYKDEAFSGRTSKRPAFSQMIKDARNNPDWDAVLIFNTSRFFRNDAEALYYRNMLRDLGIDLISVTQEFDDSPTGRLMETISFALDAYSSNINALHTHSGMREKAKMANHCGGVPPLGYDVDADKKLVINPEEAEIVKQIFNMYENGFSYKKMADILNSRGYRSKNGTPFSKNSFNSILRQEKYIGKYTWNKTREKNSKDKRNSHAQKPLEDQIIIEDGCPAIISHEQFNRVQEKLNKRTGATARRHYMLSGLQILKCAECGSYLVGNPRTSHGTEYTTYACPNHKSRGGNKPGVCPTKEIRADHLDHMVAGLIIQDLSKRNDIDVIATHLNHDDEYARLLQKQKGLEKASANILKALEHGCTDVLVKKLQHLSDERKAVEAAIAKCKADTVMLTPDNMKQICKRLGRHLITSGEPETKAYIKSIVKEIAISNNDAVIKLNIA